MSADPRSRLKVLLLTDVFPPAAGGSGWSTYYLGKALRDRGHDVRFMRPCVGEIIARPRRRVVEYEGMPVEEILIPPAPPLLRGLGLKRVYEQRSARRALAHAATVRALQDHYAVLHGGHAISAVSASRAARRARLRVQSVVSVATVRDYWPLCPSSTRLFKSGNGQSSECPDCHRLPAYLVCASRPPIVGGVSGSLLWPVSAAKWTSTRVAARDLNKCDAVVAVSHYVERELARSGRVEASRLTVIPNLVDLPSVERALSGTWPLHDISPEDPFLLFVGKLDENKGVRLLLSLAAKAAPGIPLVVAGSGPLRETLQAEAHARGLDFRFYDWLENDSILLLMNRAQALVFPSAWQEPLSRVLLEALAAGAAILALNTGGTSDAIEQDVNGLLAEDPDEMARKLAGLLRDSALDMRLRQGALRTAAEKFAGPVVSAQVERLYWDLLGRAQLS